MLCIEHCTGRFSYARGKPKTNGELRLLISRYYCSVCRKSLNIFIFISHYFLRWTFNTFADENGPRVEKISETLSSNCLNWTTLVQNKLEASKLVQKFQNHKLTLSYNVLFVPECRRNTFCYNWIGFQCRNHCLCLHFCALHSVWGNVLGCLHWRRSVHLHVCRAGENFCAYAIQSLAAVKKYLLEMDCS